MQKTVFIGQSFLRSGDFSDYYYFFYGANHISTNIWQANLSKCNEISSAPVSTPFCLNLEVGSSLRFPNSVVFIQKDGSVGMRSDYITDSYKGRCPVVSVKIVGIGQDFLTVEYILAK